MHKSPAYPSFILLNKSLFNPTRLILFSLFPSSLTMTLLTEPGLNVSLNVEIRMLNDELSHHYDWTNRAIRNIIHNQSQDNQRHPSYLFLPLHVLRATPGPLLRLHIINHQPYLPTSPRPKIPNHHSQTRTTREYLRHCSPLRHLDAVLSP